MNQNKTSWIQIRCTQQEKAAIVRQLKDNEKLSQFMLAAAGEKVNRRLEGQTMNKHAYIKSVALLHKAEQEHCFEAILLQMDLSAHMSHQPLITSVVFDALDKAREEGRV